MDDENIFVKFGERLREARRTARMTQEDLANVLGCSSTAIVNYESGRRRMPLDMVVKVTKYFDVSMDAMVGLRPYNVRFAQQWREELGDNVFSDEEGMKIIEYAKFIIQLREEEQD